MKFAPATLALSAALALTGCASTMDSAYAPSGGYRYADSERHYRDYCRDRKRDGKIAGGVVGAVAGALIGNEIEDHEGAVIGGIAGAAIGSNIGGKAAACDDRGAYWSEGDTLAYSSYSGYRGRYDDEWYSNRRCRWARDWRGDYVRVCPDSSGRYRVAY